jgi:hypothetical protein
MHRVPIAVGVLALFAQNVLAQPHAHSTTRDSVSVMGTLLSTTSSPAVNGRTRTEVQLTQPMIAMRGGRGDAFRYVGMMNAEHWTMPRGEPVPGIWGEGFVERRHPHTVIHELMATAMLRRDRWTTSLSLGRGFTAFGSDDPMVRPFTKYPANHHLAQVMERVQLTAAVQARGRASLEVGTFNGDEPLSPTAAPQWRRFGDSRTTRLTLWPLDGLELQASFADLRSPEFVRAEGLNHRKRHISARWTPARRAIRYALVEWGGTTERDGSRDVVTFNTGLAESQLQFGRGWLLALRAEQTSRPEDERLLDRFRTGRPPNHLTIQGVTRWRIGTLALARTVTRPGGRGDLTPFVETAVAQSTPQLSPVLLNPRDFIGANVAWHLSVGVRLSAGSMAARAGRYGAAAAPAPSHVMLGMSHAP